MESKKSKTNEYRSRLTDIENKPVFTRGEREEGGRIGVGIKRHKLVCIK